MGLAALLAMPLAGLALLLAVPELDVMWEHHPSHFWLVLGVAVVNVVLSVLTSEAASQRNDARLFLVSLAMLSSAGFLALHALATPGVLLDGAESGVRDRDARWLGPGLVLRGRVGPASRRGRCRAIDRRRSAGSDRR